MRHPNTQLCIYCNEAEADTRDHIPPKALFAPPRPDDLITVPSCTRCNRGFCRDDEHFRAVLSIRHDIYTHSAVNRPAILRSLKRPQATGLRASLLAGMVELPIVTRAGHYVGSAGTYSVNFARLNATAARISRGLYWRETGSPIPTRFRACAYVADSLRPSSSATEVTLRRLAEFTKAAAPRRIAHGAFTYWFRNFDDVPEAAAVAFLLYDRVVFLGWTHRKDAVDPR